MPRTFVSYRIIDNGGFRKSEGVDMATLSVLAQMTQEGKQIDALLLKLV